MEDDDAQPQPSHPIDYDTEPVLDEQDPALGPKPGQCRADVSQPSPRS